MAHTFTVTITDSDKDAFDFVSTNADQWVENAITERVRIAKDEIVSLLVAHCNANDIAIATGVDAQVAQAYELGVVKTASDRDAELLASAPTE